jgi:hypothetical protein
MLKTAKGRSILEKEKRVRKGKNQINPDRPEANPDKIKR